MGDMQPGARGYRLGVDVGGTFTDVCVFTPEGNIYRAKTPTTVGDQSIGVRNGIEKLRAQLADKDVKFDFIHHGTTTATNAILEGKGAKVALVVTEGHRSILQLRRSQIPGGLAGWITWQQPDPLVPLELTIEAPERTSVTGEIVRPLDVEKFIANLQDLKRQKPEAITVSLLNSFTNDANEKQVLEILGKEFPDIPIVLSSDVLPEMSEYERTVTASANGVVQPVVQKYIENLATSLKGATDNLRILKSDGGLTSTDLASRFPVNLLMSGPAGGVTGVADTIAKRTKYRNLITLDMGGTSADVALIENDVPLIRRETIVGNLTVKAPSVDVRTVGAGGGSIAKFVELTNALRVGPESAGASPGPAAYGKGGLQPTVTDANVALGYLPKSLLGGDFVLDVDAAKKAVQSVADAMKLPMEETAEGILKLVNETMFRAVRMVSIEQGQDPRDFSLVAFGGAGPMHACAVGKLLGAYPIIVPPAPGILCAQGDVTTKLRHEVAHTFVRLVRDIDTDELLQLYDDLGAKCSRLLRDSAGVAKTVLQFQGDLRYKGQALSLSVDVTRAELQAAGPAVFKQKFDDAHIKQFSFKLDVDLEFLGVRAIGVDDSDDTPFAAMQQADGAEPPKEALKNVDAIHFEGHTHEAGFWDRALLLPGHVLQGPCVITEMDSNTFVHPDHYAEIDEVGNILLWPKERKQKLESKQNITQEEARAIVARDPVIADLCESALKDIRSEMDTIMTRAAMSPAIREQQDEFNVITNPAGQMLVGQFGSFIGQFLAAWAGTIEEGDVFVTNDVYQIDGAVSHLNDVIVLLPVFFDGQLVGFTANFGHMTDVSGKVPGSLSINSTTVFEDGLQIPIVKLYSRGAPNTDLIEVFCRNSRLPEWFRSDLSALVASCSNAGKRVQELCERFGAAVYQAATDDLLARNRAAMQKLIAQELGDQPSFFEDFVDDDGQGIGPYRLSCRLFKEAGRLVLDWDGTSPQSNSSINYYFSKNMMKMFVGYYLLHVFDPASVVNDGFHDLVDVRIPEGSVLRPVRPAALSCRTHFLGRTMDVIQALFGQRNPAFLCAAGFSDSPHFFYSGFKPTGESFLLYQIGFGGVPARPAGDGPDCHCLFPLMKSVPTEFIELYYPLRLEANESLADSGGPGFFRGGNAQRTLYRFLAEGEFSIHDDRWLTKPWGIQGGAPGARSRKCLFRADAPGTRAVLPSKCDHVHVYPGDLLEWVTWGGGGLGDPLTRPPALVAKEVHRRLVTLAGARRYGVVVDETDFSVDEAATEALRTSMREARGDVADAGLYNRGGSMKELLESCFEETGLKPPKPQWSKPPYGPHVGLPYVKKWYAEMAAKGGFEY